MSFQKTKNWIHFKYQQQTFSNHFMDEWWMILRFPFKNKYFVAKMKNNFWDATKSIRLRSPSTLMLPLMNSFPVSSSMAVDKFTLCKIDMSSKSFWNNSLSNFLFMFLSCQKTILQNGNVCWFWMTFPLLLSFSLLFFRKFNNHSHPFIDKSWKSHYCRAPEIWIKENYCCRAFVAQDHIKFTAQKLHSPTKGRNDNRVQPTKYSSLCKQKWDPKILDRKLDESGN